MNQDWLAVTAVTALFMSSPLPLLSVSLYKLTAVTPLYRCELPRGASCWWKIHSMVPCPHMSRNTCCIILPNISFVVIFKGGQGAVLWAARNCLEPCPIAVGILRAESITWTCKSIQSTECKNRKERTSSLGKESKKGFPHVVTATRPGFEVVLY